MAITIKLTVNGTPRELPRTTGMPLLYALRDQLGLHGLHFGCGLAQCGACTCALLRRSIALLRDADLGGSGREVVTLEGRPHPKPHPLQQAFIDEQAAQCGYCINGMIMQAAAFLATTGIRRKSRFDRRLPVICAKCGTHVRILRAVMRAAEDGLSAEL